MPRPRHLLIALLTACGLPALLASGAAARVGTPLQVGSGVVRFADGTAFPWRVGAMRGDVAGLPGACTDVDHSWNADGSSFGNDAVDCVVGRVGSRFSLHAGTCRGVAANLGRAALGDDAIRKVAFAVDPRARTLRIAYPGGEHASVRTHAAPRGLRLPVRFAWRVDGSSGPLPTSAVAYGPARHGHRAVVGRWHHGVHC